MSQHSCINNIVSLFYAIIPWRERWSVSQNNLKFGKLVAQGPGTEIHLIWPSFFCTPPDCTDDGRIFYVNTVSMSWSQDKKDYPLLTVCAHSDNHHVGVLDSSHSNNNSVRIAQEQGCDSFCQGYPCSSLLSKLCGTINGRNSSIANISGTCLSCFA